MILSDLGIINPTPYGFHAILKEPVKCACGRMAAMVVNRGGKTRCVSCDEKLDQVWSVSLVKGRRGLYRVVKFDGYNTGEPFLLIRAPTRVEAVRIYKSMKSDQDLAFVL